MVTRFVSYVLLLIPCLTFTWPAFAQEKVRFPIAISSKTTGYAPVWAALRQGYYAQHGLDAQLVVIRGSDKSMQALAGGSVYVSVTGSDAPLTALDRGLDTVIIAGGAQRPAHFVIGGKSHKTYDELRGTMLGAASLTTGTGFMLRRVLSAKGLEYPKDYKLLVIGGTPQLFAALVAKQISAAALAMPYNFIAEEQGYNVIGSFLDVFPNQQLTTLSGKRSSMEKNRSLIVRFLKAYVRGTRWLFEQQEAAVTFIAKEFELKPAHARKAWQYYAGKGVWETDGRVNLEGMKTVIQMSADQSQSKGPLPSPSKYIDDSYLTDALRELKEGKIP